VCKKSANKLDVYYSLNLLEQKEKYALYWESLDQREKMIASHFKQQKLTDRYVIAHGLLRECLASYVNESAKQLVIKQAEKGKPFLAAYPDLSFNMSHTGNAWMLAVIPRKCQLGVDIEFFKARESWAGLVKKCFSLEESEYWHRLNAEQQGRIFYQLWVRKEAFVNAVGQGITLGLNLCVVDPVTMSHFLRVPNRCGAANNWAIYPVDFSGDLFAALVCDQQGLGLNLLAIKAG
jgi:4'-phosphopantetheinyl transferase